MFRVSGGRRYELSLMRAIFEDKQRSIEAE